MRTPLIGFGVLAIVAMAPLRIQANDDLDGACTSTARAEKSACDAETVDDYWIAIAKCRNLPGSQTASCRRTAREEYRDTRDHCRDQQDAREELCDAIGEGIYHPDLRPSRFVSPAAAAANPNPFFRLVPGFTRVYSGGTETITVTVTNQTRVVQGVTCTVVRDIVLDGSQMIEDTVDYFAQDVDGNVWYFGEAVKNFENGELVNLDGSFEHGVNGDKAGIIMKAHPQAGETYRQEFAVGNAEDAARVMSTTGSANVPAAACAGTCLVTQDFTPIEPTHVEEKYYAAGIGLIFELVLDTGETKELVSYSN